MKNKEMDDLVDNVAGVANDAINDYRTASSKTKNIILKAATAILVLLAGGTDLMYYRAFKSVSEKTGEIMGQITGVIDSIPGMPNVYDEEKRKQLSAEDTEAYISNKMDKIGVLEVYDVGVTLKDIHTIGEDYAAIYVAKGNAIFSVDLRKAKISAQGDRISVSLPEVQVEVYVDERETEKMAEWMKHSWTGKTEDGYLAYLNSFNKSREEINKAIDNYDELVAEANNVAEKQVTAIVKACRGTSTEVIFVDGDAS